MRQLWGEQLQMPLARLSLDGTRTSVRADACLADLHLRYQTKERRLLWKLLDLPHHCSEPVLINDGSLQQMVPLNGRLHLRTVHVLQHLRRALFLDRQISWLRERFCQLEHAIAFWKTGSLLVGICALDTNLYQRHRAVHHQDVFLEERQQMDLLGCYHVHPGELLGRHRLRRSNVWLAMA